VYKTVITERALKDLKQIDIEQKQRILVKIKEYSTDPYYYSDKLVNPIIGTYRFRIGDYRAIFDFEDETIIVLRIGHRKDIYK
jgi:mRNA interferase RelE/StbE